MVIASKTFFDVGPEPNAMGATRNRILSQSDESLRRLGADHLDRHHIHCRDASTPLEEALGALDGLVRLG